MKSIGKSIGLVVTALALLLALAPVGAYAHHSTAHSIGTRGR